MVAKIEWDYVGGISQGRSGALSTVIGSTQAEVVPLMNLSAFLFSYIASWLFHPFLQGLGQLPPYSNDQRNTEKLLHPGQSHDLILI